jgi:hypothetical protein
MELAIMKYSITNYTFLSDSLPDFPHFAPIKKLTFIQRQSSGISEIGVLDELGVISTWSVIEMADHAITDYELNLNLGGKFKMVMNYSDNLTRFSNVVDLFSTLDVLASLDVEFDPTNTQIYYFSTSGGLFRMDKTGELDEPVKIDTIGLSAPTALSMSDEGLLLAAFSCGSICLYDKLYTSPLTVWY